jgi:hypothetical protein
MVDLTSATGPLYLSAAQRTNVTKIRHYSWPFEGLLIHTKVSRTVNFDAFGIPPHQPLQWTPTRLMATSLRETVLRVLSTGIDSTQENKED